MSATERPILFSAPMVRAILARRKTQTRRVVTARNTMIDGHLRCFVKVDDLDLSGALVDQGPSPAGNPGPYLKAPHRREDTRHRVYPRYQAGDHLWVKETHVLPLCIPCEAGVIGPCVCRDRSKVSYRADGGDGPWSPSIFMTRWASRITLPLARVRLERLQDITEEDASAEGVDADEWQECCGEGAVSNGPYEPPSCCGDPLDIASYRSAFERLWDSINSKRPGCSWNDNPWVWVLEWRADQVEVRR